jgi:F5/8 type C domain
MSLMSRLRRVLAARRKPALLAVTASAVLVALAGYTALTIGSAAAASTLLSQGKPATASSTEGAGNPASAAVDGNTATRWSSAFSDPQWIQVDLGQTASITQVVLQWETAAGKAFQIQVSADAANWTSIYTTTTGTGGTQTLNVTGSGRYVRMYGTARTTGYVGDRLRDGVPDSGLGRRGQLDVDLLHDHRHGRTADTKCQRHRPVPARLRHRPGHRVRVLDLGAGHPHAGWTDGQPVALRIHRPRHADLAVQAGVGLLLRGRQRAGRGPGRAYHDAVEQPVQ